jgi:hypothetical protein
LKTLSVPQPQASLIALGHQATLRLSWSTSYRGPLAIYACSSFKYQSRQESLGATNKVLFSVFYGPTYTPERLPLGQILCTCHLLNVLKLMPGKYLWLIRDARLLDLDRELRVMPARGGRGLWEWNEARRPRLLDDLGEVPAWPA